MPPNCRQSTTAVKFNPENNEIQILIACFAYLNLTISCAQTIYKAYINDDFPMVAFVIFVFFGYFGLMKCFSALDQLPAGERSVKRDLLGLIVWGVTTTMWFGFAYQFSTFMNLAVSVSLYSIAIVSSVLLFYLHFVHGDREDRNLCSRVEKITAFWYIERRERGGVGVHNESKAANSFYEKV